MGRWPPAPLDGFPGPATRPATVPAVGPCLPFGKLSDPGESAMRRRTVWIIILVLIIVAAVQVALQPPADLHRDRDPARRCGPAAACLRHRRGRYRPGDLPADAGDADQEPAGPERGPEAARHQPVARRGRAAGPGRLARQGDTGRYRRGDHPHLRERRRPEDADPAGQRGDRRLHRGDRPAGGRRPEPAAEHAQVLYDGYQETSRIRGGS